MSHRSNKLLRSLQRFLHSSQEKIRFKTSHISLGGKIAILGVFFCFVSLFMPWVLPIDTMTSGGTKSIPVSSSFSPLLGFVGFFIAITLCIITFSICSIQKKEKFHFISMIQLSDYLSTLLGSIFIFIFSLHSFFLVNGLHFFSINILYGQGIMLCITGSIIIFIGSRIIKTEQRKNIKGSYVSELHTAGYKEEKQELKSNMKLPF